MRFTQNGAELPLGDGFWKSIRAIRQRRVFVARESEQALVYAVLEDERGLALLVARLGFADGALRELETLLTHAGESSIFAAESLLAGEAVEARVLEPFERSERAALIAVVDAYFEGIERDSSAGVAFHPECQRVENGVQMTSNPAVLGGLGVAEQFDHKVFAYIARVRARRYPLIDVATGQVLAIVFLDVPGTVDAIELGGRTGRARAGSGTARVTARGVPSVSTHDACSRRGNDMAGRIGILALALFAFAPAVHASGIEGTWRSAAGTIDVRIAPCGPALCGTIARVVSDRSMADPSVSMTGAPGVGIVVLSNFLPSEDEADSFDGYLYNRENRKMYACVMSLEAPDRLRIHAYVGVQLLGQTQTWMRVAE